MTTIRSNDDPAGPAHAFPPVGRALVEGVAPPGEIQSFLEAFRRWRHAAETWARTAAHTGLISQDMGNLLLWTMGSRANKPALPSPYVLTQLDDVADGSASAVLVWRSGLVDFLADVWDTIGAAAFEPQECMVVLEEIFTPHRVRGVLHCPDCVQVLPSDPAASGQHPLVCPVRMSRLRA